MNDLAFYASDIFEGLLSLIGAFLFFVFVLPPFLVIFIPLLILSSSIIICGVGLYLTHVFFGVSWELTKNFIFWLWPSQRPNGRRRPRRRSVYEMRQDIAALSELVEFDKERRQSGFVTPRRIAQPRSRSGSMHLKKSDSLRSLVGPSSDHDFEDTGGWANSHEDDEAMYMSRTMGIHDAVYTPGVLHGSEVSLHNYSPTGTRTPVSNSRPVSRGEPWKFMAGGTGATTPKAHRSGTATPESYFSLPAAQSKAFQVLDQSNAHRASSPIGHRKTASVTSVVGAPQADAKSNQRDSGFFS